MVCDLGLLRLEFSKKLLNLIFELSIGLYSEIEKLKKVISRWKIEKGNLRMEKIMAG